MKAYIPNFLTLCNVFCGSVAALFAVLNQLDIAALFVFLGIAFDFFDGLAARALGVESPLGEQLDSLADVITSGLVPGIAMFQLLAMSETGGWNISLTGSSEFGNTAEGTTLLPYAGFIITMAAAYRLARFNIDDSQVDSFRGLPTPANALLILSFPLILLYQGNDTLNSVILNPWILIGTTLLSAFLMNSRIRLFALKFKNWSFKDNALRYLFVAVSLTLLLTLQFMAVPVIIALYIISSLAFTWGSETNG